MVATRPGDDPTPRAGEGGPRRTTTQLASDPAFTGTYVQRAGGTSTLAAPLPFVNVRDYGAVGDGAADDTAAIQTAINAVKTSGGTVLLPVGTFIVTALTLYSYVTLQGADRVKTAIKLKDGANADVLKTNGADALFGTNGSAGEHHWSLRDLTIDGNKANNPTGGCGIKAYGASGPLERVIVQNCNSHGIYTDWNNSAGAGQSYDSRWDSVHSHDNGGNGIDFSGAHDSQWLNVASFNNAAIGIRIGLNASILKAVNCHSFGYGQTKAWQVEGVTHMVNCQGEGASICQLLILVNGCEVWGGTWFAGDGRVQPTTKGIVIGDATHTNITGTMLFTGVSNCEGGSFDFTYSGGNGHAIGGAFQNGSNPAIIGNVPTNQCTFLQISGARAADSVCYYPSEGVQIRGAGANAILIVGSQQMFQINASAKAVALPNGTLLRGYSDNYTTQTFLFEGASGHWTTGGAAPTAAVAGGAGTGATVTVSGNDTAGTITLTTGTGPSTGGQVNVTFAIAFGSAPKYVKFAAESGAAALLVPYTASRSTTGFTLGLANTPAASTSYTFTYHVVG